MPNLVEVIKKVSMEAVNASNPTNLVIGKVTSIAPLKIAIDQKLLLDKDFLILTNNVKDHYVDVGINYYSSEETHSHTCPEGSTSSHTHKHKNSGKKKMLMHYGLKDGESVLLIKIQGGQKYIVLDRLTDIKTEGEWV